MEKNKVLLVSDFVGVGNVALSMMIPILNTMQIDVSYLPTAIISNNFEYGEAVVNDLTDFMKKNKKLWKKLDIQFSTIATGILMNLEQVEIIKQIIEYQNKEPFVISDPIIGENGSLYPGMPENSIAASQLMALEADLIIPNLTELCFILEEEYPVERKLTHEQMIAWLMKIKDRGIKSVVVTSVPIDSECYVYGYSQTEDIFRVKIDYVPIEVGGTGDMFTSLLIGSYVDKRTLEDSVKYATGIITKIILKEYKEGRNNKVNEIKVQNHLPYIYKTL